MPAIRTVVDLIAGSSISEVIILMPINPREVQQGLDGSALRPVARSARRRVLPATPAFALAYLRNPLAIGACCPSSARLARTIAAAIDPFSDGLVVELGGGTGAITKALLDRGVRADRLLVGERDPGLSCHLRRRFRAVRIITADAGDLHQLLARGEGGGRVATIVSSLPLISLSRDEVRAIGVQICTVLARGGLLVQYTYQMALGHTRVPGCLEVVARRRVWLNVPPARVEVYRHLA